MLEIIAKIKAINKILESRNKKTNIDLYNSGEKVHKKQLDFHKNTQRNRWVFGGNRTGKTECGAVECVWLARGIHPFKENKPNLSGWVVSLSHQVQRDVAQNKIMQYLNPDWIEEVVMIEGKKSSPAYGIIDYILIKNVCGGVSKLAFKSCDQGREKFQGTSLDFVWFDEEPPYDVYQECKMRVIDKQGLIFGTMTPLKGLSFVYEEIYLNKHNDPHVWHEFISWEDNPFLSSSEIEHLKSTMSRSELDSRCYGKFASNGGMVYDEFDETLNVIEPFNVPVEWYDNISIDPGLHNPLSAHFYAEDFDGNIYVIAEHYQAEKPVEYHAQKIKEIAHKLNWHRLHNGMIGALIDSASNQRSLGSLKSVSELFYENGIVVNTKVNKDLFSGINVVKSYIKNVNGERKLFIFKNCVNLIREIKTYFWGNGEVPTKKDDHALDELRYYLMFKNNSLSKRQPKNNAIQKDKARLAKKIRGDFRL